MTSLNQFIEGKVRELNERFFVVGQPLNFSELESFITHSLQEAYELGQQNPLVWFLRQYLNENYSPAGETSWTDDMLEDFLRIPFKGSLSGLSALKEKL